MLWNRFTLLGLLLTSLCQQCVPFLWRATSRSRGLGSQLVAKPFVFDEDVELLIAAIGEKHLLQEVSQHLFNGANPSISWIEETGTVGISLADKVHYKLSVKEVQNRTISSKYRKEHEMLAARNTLKMLATSTDYEPLIKAFFAKRLNRDNAPKRIKRSQLFNLAATKSLVVLVDVENVPDFRRAFYINKEGEIKFAAPAPPPIRRAPSITVNDAGTPGANGDDFFTSQPFQDEETLVLTYAHTRSSHCSWANRVIWDDTKDAADSLILFDLGALQLISAIAKIVVVTHDKFGQNAESCFYNDFQIEMKRLKTLSKDQADLQPHHLYYLDQYRSPSNTKFVRVADCVTAARNVGRLQH